jgi:ATP-dependent DNA ligase
MGFASIMGGMEFIYPPRPCGKISPNQLGKYEASGKWVVQRKFNGTRIVVIVAGNRTKIFNRHTESPKQFALTPAISTQIVSLNLDAAKTYYFDAELLHSKTKDGRYKSKIVLFDILVAGKHLFCGPSLEDRLKMLSDICGNPQKLEPAHGIALAVSDNLWMAETYSSNFKERFDEFKHLDEIEGLVIKLKGSRLDNLGKREHDVNWQIRCRKPHGKSYEF